MAIDRSGERRAMEARLDELLPRLNERDRRLTLGAEAKAWGYGGIEQVHRATGAARSTIKRGMRDLDEGEQPGAARVRASGGGRKRAEDTDSALVDAMNSLIEPGARGD